MAGENKVQEKDKVPDKVPDKPIPGDVFEKIRRLMFLSEGFCPNCNQRVRHWKPVRLMEIKSELINSGINPVTGHRVSCAG